MLNGSFSSRTLRLLDCPDLLDHVDQKLLFSVGEGCSSSAQFTSDVGCDKRLQEGRRHCR